ncbi:GntR family transcriptional regulator [Sphingomonas sp. DBB INV C78]|uniref:GntR family transcriptional regulator n=1 Tax=Sphingomonas sp. DBB INV C78 TaxID=3349434 RepID=UPI0036D43427
MSKASDAAYRFIRGEILSGALEPGEQLREEQLAAACGVSRTPIREALRRLESEHFVRRNESQRTFVAEWSLDEIEEGFVLRAMLEGHAAARAAERAEDVAINALAAHNNAIGLAAKLAPPDVAAFLDHNRAFHAIILEMAGSARLAALLGTIIEQPIVTRTALQYDRVQILQSHAEHDELIQAFRRRDPEWAKAVMTSHIRRAFHAYRDAFRRAGGRERQAAE